MEDGVDSCSRGQDIPSTDNRPAHAVPQKSRLLPLPIDSILDTPVITYYVRALNADGTVGSASVDQEGLLKAATDTSSTYVDISFIPATKGSPADLVLQFNDNVTPVDLQRTSRSVTTNISDIVQAIAKRMALQAVQAIKNSPRSDPMGMTRIESAEICLQVMVNLVGQRCKSHQM